MKVEPGMLVRVAAAATFWSDPTMQQVQQLTVQDLRNKHKPSGALLRPIPRHRGEEH